MAKTLSNDFERERRIELVGNYFLKTGYSTRKIAIIFSSDPKYFKVSNATVKDYLDRYKLLHLDKADQIDALIDANKSVDIKNPLVIDRVLSIYNLIKEGKNIIEISKFLNLTYWKVYYDIHIRLRKIDINKYNEIKNKL